MPASHRLGDMDSGHGCFPPRPNDQGSPNVHANGLPVNRVGDHFVTHCCDIPCHDSVASTGSPNVHANGIPKTRVNDSVACGSTMATGSPNYFINGR